MRVIPAGLAGHSTMMTTQPGHAPIRMWYAVLLVATLSPAGAFVRTWRIELPRPTYCVNPFSVATSSVNGDLYVADTAVVIVGRPGLTPVCRLPIGRYVRSMTFAGRADKLYCLTDQGVVAVDCRSRAVLGFLPGCPEPAALAYCPSSNRLYVASPETGRNPTCVQAYDCSADTVTGMLELDSVADPFELCVNPVTSVLYMTERRHSRLWSVSVESGRARPLDDGVSAIAVDPVRNKVYLGQEEAVLVLDGATDSTIATIDLSNYIGFVEQLIYNRTFDRMYCTEQDCWPLAIDCAGDTVVASFEGDWYPSGQVCLTGDERYLVALGAGELAVVDCAADSLAGFVPIGWSQGFLFGQPGSACACFASLRGVLVLIDCDERRLSDLLVTTDYYRPAAAAYDGKQQLLYVYCDCPGDELNLIAELDPFTGELRRLLYGIGYPYQLLCAAPYQKLYSVSEVLGVVDLAAGSTRRLCPGIEFISALGFSASLDRLYCLTVAEGRYSILGLDCATDRVVDSLPLARRPEAALYDSVGRRFCVAWAHGNVMVWDEGASEPRFDVQAVAGIRAMCVEPGLGLLCCLAESTMVTIDLAEGQLHRVAIPGSARASLGVCVNPDQHKAYCVAHDSVLVVNLIDSRSVVGVPVPGAVYPSYSSKSRAVYCGADSGLVVIDGEHDTVRQFIRQSCDWRNHAWDTLRNRFYAPEGQASVVVYADTVLEDAKPRQTVLADTLRVQGPLRQELYDAVGRRRAALEPGINDLGQLSRGVYFVYRRAEHAVRKIVIAR